MKKILHTEKEKKQQEADMLSRIVELSLLYDFYGALLKENKRSIFEDYILNDYSLSEIANEHGMSRQGVYDIVKRCSKELMHYEEALNLIYKFNQTKEKVHHIHQIAKEMREANTIDQIGKIEALSNQILEEL